MSLKIRHKLFLAILSANLLLAVGIYVLSIWIFGSSFRDYIDQSAAEKLTPMVAAISEKYRVHHNWDWVRERRAREWRTLLREHVLDRPRREDFSRFFPGQSEQRPPRQMIDDEPPDAHMPGKPGDGPPKRREKSPLDINPRLLLADNNRQLIIGMAEHKDEAFWIPINVDDNLVGYLGFVRTVKLTSRLDQVFASKLQISLVWITLGLVLITILIAFPLARLMVKPLIRLREAASALSSGKYDTRIPVRSHDEIGELSEDFNNLAATLQKNLHARQQWIADISHELRTPLSILQGELEAIQDGVRHLSTETIDSLHQEILGLSRLVNDLHELSLSDIGALSYQKNNINLVKIIKDVLLQSKDMMDRKSITLNLETTSDTITINGDEQRLRQLYKNLLNNSLFYTDENGFIDINIRNDSNYIYIDWSDSEPGVDESMLPLLFERLFRAESSRNRNSGGAGLGLAICKNIVEAHFGTIEARHSPRGGVTLQMRFPFSRTKS